MIARYRPQSQAPLSILDALDDPLLFGGELSGPSWTPWRSFLAAAFALPRPSLARLKLFRECTGRNNWPTKPFNEISLIVGRRGGKSRCLAFLATYLACFIDWQPHLAVGEEAVVAVIACDRVQARVILRYVKGFLRNVSILEELIDDELTESIRLSNRVTIEIHTAKIASPRGRSFAAVCCDEIAFWRSDDSTNPDREVIAGIRPGLASLAMAGSMLLLASSPYARKGVLWDSYRRNYGKDDARVLCWKAPTLTMNSALDPAIVREVYEEDPASAAAEYGADFRTDVETFVSREVVAACTVIDRRELMPVDNISYSGFVDPSGGSADGFSAAVGHREGDRGILDMLYERRPPFSPEDVIGEISARLKDYRISSVIGDRFGGEFPRELFRKQGIRYEPSTKPKSDIYKELLPLLNSNKVELLDLPRLEAQLIGLERRTARGGRDSIDHAPNSHDDLVNAAAGVLVAVAGKPDRSAIWAAL